MRNAAMYLLMGSMILGKTMGCHTVDDVDTSTPSSSPVGTDTPASSPEPVVDDMGSETDSDDMGSETDSGEALRCEDMTPCERVDYGNGWACPETAGTDIDCVRVRVCDRTLCVSYEDACRLSGCDLAECGVLDTDPGEVVCR
jgi:hypothetical protein